MENRYLFHIAVGSISSIDTPFYYTGQVRTAHKAFSQLFGSFPKIATANGKRCTKLTDGYHKYANFDLLLPILVIIILFFYNKACLGSFPSS